jgi:hypothetical protein
MLIWARQSRRYARSGQRDVGRCCFACILGYRNPLLPFPVGPVSSDAQAPRRHSYLAENLGSVNSESQLRQLATARHMTEPRMGKPSK